MSDFLSSGSGVFEEAREMKGEVFGAIPFIPGTYEPVTIDPKPQYIFKLNMSNQYFNSKGKIDYRQISFKEVYFNSIKDLANRIEAGFCMLPGLYDYEDGKEYTDSKQRRGKVDINKLTRRWTLLDHWCGGHIVCFDIDEAKTMTASEYISRLQYHPHLVYNTFSCTPDNNKFRIVYIFSEYLTKNQWFSAYHFLADHLQQVNPEIPLDQSAGNGNQMMNGSYKGSIVFLDYSEDYYVYDDLGCPSLEFARKTPAQIDVPGLIIKQMSEMGQDGQGYISYVTSNYCYGKTKNGTGIGNYYGHLFQLVYRTEGEWIPVNWEIDGKPVTIEYQEVNPDTYLDIPSPPQKINVGEGRHRYLRKCAYMMRMIKPNITMAEMLYSLIIYRDSHCHLGSGKDRIVVQDLFSIISLVYSKSQEGIEQLTASWCDASRHRNENKHIIIRNLYIPRQFNFTVEDEYLEYRRISSTRFGCCKLDKKLAISIAATIKSWIYGARKNLDLYYSSHSINTPVSQVAEELGISYQTVYNYLHDTYDDSDLHLERKQRTDYTKRGKLTVEQFASLYKPELDDEENRINMRISRNTYYKYKRLMKRDNLTPDLPN